MEASEKIILGIDPGTRLMGYGVLKVKGSVLSYVDMGVLDLRRENDPLFRLEKIHEEVTRVIRLYNPDCLSIETPFYGKNVQSLIKLGRAQGVAIAAAIALGVKVYEYAPLKIKQSITGKGSASKEQVCAMVFRLLHLKESDKPAHLDATDAMAAAICHGLHCHIEEIKQARTGNRFGLAQNLKSGRKSKSGGKSQKTAWGDFLAQNPDRIL